MAGPNWKLFRERGGDGECMVLVVGGAEQRQCGLEQVAELPGPALVAGLPDGRRVVVVPMGTADQVERLRSGNLSPHPTGVAHDPFVPGLRIFAAADEGIYFLRRGDAILGALYQASLLGGPGPFGPFPDYRRTHQTVSERRFHEVGVYATGGETCLLVRELSYPAIRANHCVGGRPATFTTVLNVAGTPMLAELYAMAPLTDATEWNCELPSGTSCGGGPVVEVEALGAAVLARHDPITLDDGGTRADRVTIVLGDQRVEVPVERP